MAQLRPGLFLVPRSAKTQLQPQLSATAQLAEPSIILHFVNPLPHPHQVDFQLRLQETDVSEQVVCKVRASGEQVVSKLLASSEQVVSKLLASFEQVVSKLLANCEQMLSNSKW